MQFLKKSIFILTLCLLWVTYSCSSLKNVKVEERYGKRIAYIKEGSGTPAIILESGFDAGMESWAGLIDSLSRHSMVYAYDRPGYGRSNKKDAPGSMREIAQQLHSNLVARNIPPPYVLVGYSGGALMINMFTRLYPQEVAGVLMIEPTHPDLYDYLRENENVLYDVMFDYIGEGQRRYEFDIIKNVSEEFRNAPPFPNVPLTILMAGKHTTLTSEALKAKTLEFHEDLKNMSTLGKRYMVDSGELWIHRNNPKLIEEYVYELLVD